MVFASKSTFAYRNGKIRWTSPHGNAPVEWVPPLWPSKLLPLALRWPAPLTEAGALMSSVYTCHERCCYICSPNHFPFLSGPKTKPHIPRIPCSFEGRDTWLNWGQWTEVGMMVSLTHKSLLTICPHSLSLTGWMQRTPGVQSRGEAPAKKRLGLTEQNRAPRWLHGIVRWAKNNFILF